MAIHKLSKNSFRSKIRSPFTGKQIKRLFQTKWEAAEFEKLILKDLVENVDVAVSMAKGLTSLRETKECPTYDEYVEQTLLPSLLTGIASPGRTLKEQQPITNYHVGKRLKRVFPFIGEIKLNHLTLDHYEKLVVKFLTEPLNKGKIYKKSTSDKILKDVRTSLNYAVKIDLIKFNPWTNGSKIHVPPTVKTHWTIDQCKDFFSVVDDPQHKLLLLMAVTYGLRRSELFGIQKDDVDLEAGVVRIQRQWDEFAYSSKNTMEWKDQLKNGQPLKVLPISKEIRPLLESHLRGIIGDKTLMFQMPISLMKTTKKLMKPYADRAGLPYISLHRLRDSMITNLSISGVPEAVIARIAGCSKDNLKIYQRFNVEDLREGIDSINFGL